MIALAVFGSVAAIASAALADPPAPAPTAEQLVGSRASEVVSLHPERVFAPFIGIPGWEVDLRPRRTPHGDCRSERITFQEAPTSAENGEARAAGPGPLHRAGSVFRYKRPGWALGTATSACGDTWTHSWTLAADDGTFANVAGLLGQLYASIASKGRPPFEYSCRDQTRPACPLRETALRRVFLSGIAEVAIGPTGVATASDLDDERPWTMQLIEGPRGKLKAVKLTFLVRGFS